MYVSIIFMVVLISVIILLFPKSNTLIETSGAVKVASSVNNFNFTFRLPELFGAVLLSLL